ncbi:MAG: hypothetical protein N3G20_09830 [Verrucomicrobiae bacterium]|nr:hypothetical protein [Verrucomicrobiae bacterium]
MKRVLGIITALFCAWAVGAGSSPVRVIISSEDGRYRLSEASQVDPYPERPTALPTIRINGVPSGQAVLGLGSSFEHATCENLGKLPRETRDKVIESLVSPSSGIGMNLMRLCIGTSDFVGEPYYTYDDLPEGETDPDLVKFSIERDLGYVLPVVRMARQKNPDLLFFASPWSPPAWMKTSGKLGTGKLKREFYPVYARYLLKFIEAYAAEGVPIYAITVQNEPQHQDPRYPTTIWSAEDQRDFIRDHLGPLFEQRKVSTLIWCWDHNWNDIDFARTVLTDPLAARYVDGTAFHHYEGEVDAQSRLHREFPHKHIYFTEGSVFGVTGALKLIDILRHGSRTYNAWVTLLDEHRRPNRGPHPASATCVELLDNGTIRYNFDYYMYGQFMKFIRRGAIRLETSGGKVDHVGHVAFLQPGGQTVLVVANAGSNPFRFVARSAGWQFEATLPARSVATYLW